MKLYINMDEMANEKPLQTTGNTPQERYKNLTDQSPTLIANFFRYGDLFATQTLVTTFKAWLDLEEQSLAENIDHRGFYAFDGLGQFRKNPPTPIKRTLDDKNVYWNKPGVWY